MWFDFWNGEFGDWVGKLFGEDDVFWIVFFVFVIGKFGNGDVIG